MNQELLQMEKKPNMLAFQVAIIYAFYSVIIIAVQRAMGVSMEPTKGQQVLWGVLAYIPFILAIVFVQQKHKKELGGFITYGRAFSAGFRTGFYTGLMIAVFMFVYYTFFDQNALQEATDFAISKAETDQQAQQIAGMGKYMIYFTIFGAAIWHTVVGLIIALIGAAVVKKERPLYFEETETTVTTDSLE